MTTTLFLATHYSAGFEVLHHALNANPRVVMHLDDTAVATVDDLFALQQLPHKCKHSGAVVGKTLVHNLDMTVDAIHRIAKFIFFIRDARHALPVLRAKTNSESACLDYYCSRLRRLCEMANKSRYAMFLTHDELQKPEAIKRVEDFLILKQPLVIPTPKQAAVAEVSYEGMQRGQAAYEQCLWYMRTRLGQSSNV